jgi:spermine/spermidine synthase
VPSTSGVSARDLAGVALVSASLLMTELALTRIFSVTMYYHFAFLAISIALFGVSASGVAAYLARPRLASYTTARLLATESLVYAACTLVALFFLVRLRVGLTYSPHNLVLMVTIYVLAALPFFAGGLVVTLAVSRMASRINVVYAADLIGAAGGCLLLIPLLDRLGASGVVLTAATLASVAAALFAGRRATARYAAVGAVVVGLPLAGQLAGITTFDVVGTKGHQGDRVLFSKWNSFSRVGVYERPHGDWSLSPAYSGPLPDTRFMDIDSAASTPILRLAPDLSNAQYLKYELTAIAYHLEARELEPQPGFTALVIGPGGGRDLASALVFGARHVDGVEINPIIADDVMRDRFAAFSGGLYTNPRVTIAVDDGRSFVRRSAARYDVIQASLVDTWAATAAGAYTLTENTLYTVDAFDDYLDHLSDDGVLSITRWVADGLRLVSLAQAACAARGWSAADRIAIVRYDRVATFLLKKSAFTPREVQRVQDIARRLGFDVLYVPGAAAPARDEWIDGVATGDYARLAQAVDLDAFYARHYYDIRPTTDDRPFFFHTTKLKNQLGVAFGRSMLFGNGLSALLTLLALSVTLVALFVIGPLLLADRAAARPRRWACWLAYFGALGAGFMLIEVSLLQRFVLLLGHPVYSLTVTLFSLLLGTGLGAAWSRRVDDGSLGRAATRALIVIAAVAVLAAVLSGPMIDWAVPFARPVRILIAIAVLLPIGVALGVPMPTGLRMLGRSAPDMVAWAWGMNGALSVVGATVAIFVAMNWGFAATLLTASAVYLIGLTALISIN